MRSRVFVRFITGVLFVVALTVPAAAREKCTRIGCKDQWSSCREGVRLPGGEMVYGRTRDCCDVEGRHYEESQECTRRPPLWGLDFGIDRWRDRFPITASEGRDGQWELDATGVAAALRTPPFFAGRVQFDPRFEIGVARADVSVDSPIVSRETATLYTGEAALELKPCALCRFSLLGAYRHRAASGLDYDSSDVELAGRYSMLAERMTMYGGFRTTRGTSSVGSELIPYGHGFDLDKDQPFAGMEVLFGRSLSGRFEMTLGDENERTAAVALTYRFTAPQQRTLPVPPPEGERPPEEELPESKPEQDCSSGIPVCQMKYKQEKSYEGAGSIQEAHDTCLLDGEKNSVWYIFTAQTSGSLTFTIQTQVDYDFALYNITEGGCASVPGKKPVRCNFSYKPVATGLTLPALDETPIEVPSSGSPTMPGVNVTAGQTYALIVDNFSSDSTGYELTFGGTASIFDNVPPALASATFVPPGGEIEITTSEPVRCSSIAADGSDFAIAAPEGATVTSAAGVGCGAFTNKIRIKYTVQKPEECGTWHLRVKTGSDGDSLVDICNNPLAGGAPLALNVSPEAVPKLTLPADAFCEGAPIIADGSGSQAEQRHFWSIVESDANWNVVPGAKECMRWYDGPAGTFDVTALAKQEGCDLKCGRYYRVKLAVHNCATTWSETVKLIRIQCPPVADAGPDKSVCCCGPQKIKIGSPAVPGLTYSWAPAIGLDNPASSNPAIDMSVFADPSVPFPSIYEVTVTDALGCKAKDSVYVKTVCGCRPGATITTSAIGICSAGVTLTANCDCGDATPSYLWSNGQTTKSITVSGGGTYSVTCSNECGATVSKPVTVPAVSPLGGGFPPIQCPNVFTPNGDGINDFWTAKDTTKPDGYVPAYNATEYQLLVYNRWGNLVANLHGSTTTGFANNSIPGWNGLATENVFYNFFQRLLGRKEAHAGQPVVDGVYYYIFRMRNCTTGWTDVCAGFTHVFH